MSAEGGAGRACICVAALVDTNVRRAAAYQLSWFDGHLWAYAERFGLSELISEDFQHGRLFGTVEAVNPFVDR